MYLITVIDVHAQNKKTASTITFYSHNSSIMHRSQYLWRFPVSLFFFLFLFLFLSLTLSNSQCLRVYLSLSACLSLSLALSLSLILSLPLSLSVLLSLLHLCTHYKLLQVERDMGNISGLTDQSTGDFGSMIKWQVCVYMFVFGAPHTRRLWRNTFHSLAFIPSFFCTLIRWVSPAILHLLSQRKSANILLSWS